MWNRSDSDTPADIDVEQELDELGPSDDLRSVFANLLETADSITFNPQK